MLSYELATGAVGLGAGTAFLVKEKNNAQVKSRELVVFTVIFMTLIALAGLSGYFSQWSLQSIFVLDQIYFLLLGILFSYFFNRRFTVKLNLPILSVILCMLGTAALGVTAFIILFNCVHPTKLGYYYSSAAILFFAPFLILEAYSRYEKIPKEIYKTWKYPGDYYDPDLGGKDFNIGPKVQMQLLETENSNIRTPSTAPANPELKLGDWFFLVLRDYPGTVATRNSKLEPYSWLIYRKPTLVRFRRYFDPDLTILDNKINKDFILIAERVIPDTK